MLSVAFHLGKNDPTLIFARDELIAHLGLNCENGEHTYPITLKVDDSFFFHGKAGEQDAYCFEFTREAGTITGSNSRSVLLGVYHYLRKLGFVFLHPGKDGTYVPKLDSPTQLFLPKTEQIAALKHRGVCIEGADSLENVLEFIDWLPKNGFNAFFVQFKKPDVFFERWYEHIFNPSFNKEEKTRKELDEMEAAVTRAIRLRSLYDHRVGHGWTAEVLGFPSSGWQVREAVEDPKRQEMIALVDGKRLTWKGVPANTNLCYSNPAAKDALIREVVEYAKEHSGTDYLHFWLADDYNNVCECNSCIGTTVADQYVDILNEMDRRLTAEGLHVKIVFLLYQELLYVPLKEKVKNQERFCMMFAPISRTFEKSYPVAFSPVPLKPYIRNAMKLPETVEENLSHFMSWKEIFDGDSFFYDYPLGRAHYGDFGYMKISRVIYEDIRTLKRLGTNGYMSCQELRVMTPHGFPDFVMGQALLDEEISYEELKETYFKALYGPEYKEAVTYLEELSDWSDTDYFNGHGPRYSPQKASSYERIRKRAEEFLEKNQGKWEYLQFHARYCIALSRALELLCQGKQEEADEAFLEFVTFIREKEPQVQPFLDVYRVIEVATKYTGFTKGRE